MDVISLKIGVDYSKESQLETNYFGIIISISKVFSLSFEIFSLYFTNQQSQALENTPVDL